MYHNRDEGHKTLYIVIAILILILLGTYGVFFYNKYQENKDVKNNELIQQGVVIGAEQAIIQLINEASKCQPFPVRYENTTVTMFALECTNLAQVASATLQARQSE